MKPYLIFGNFNWLFSNCLETESLTEVCFIHSLFSLSVSPSFYIYTCIHVCTDIHRATSASYQNGWFRPDCLMLGSPIPLRTSILAHFPKWRHQWISKTGGHTSRRWLYKFSTPFPQPKIVSHNQALTLRIVVHTSHFSVKHPSSRAGVFLLHLGGWTK